MTATTTYDGPIFDGDMHVVEDRECRAWNEYLPEKFKKDWSYQWRTADDGEYALHVGQRKVEISAGYYTEDGRCPPPGRLHEWLRAMKEGKENVDMRVLPDADQFDRDLRLQRFDQWGVEGSVMFIGNHVATLAYLDDLNAFYAVNHSYNRWLNEQWGFNFKDRIYSTPVLHLGDLDKAIAEAKYVVASGARIVVMPLGPVNGKSPAHPDFDRFWSILNEARVQVAFHVSEAAYMHTHARVWGEEVMQSRQRQTAFTWLNLYGERPVMETLSSFIFMNFFERFPQIRLTSVENGCEWVPSLLVKMDKCRGMAKNGYWPCGQLKERPSSIFKNHIFVVAYPEDDVKSVIQASGSADFILMGSDYPHAEGVAEPRDFVREGLQGVSSDDVEKVMYSNARRFLPALQTA